MGPAVLVAIASGVTETSSFDESAAAALSDAMTMLAGCPEHELRLGLDHVAALITQTELVPRLVARLRNASWRSVLRSATCMPPAAHRDRTAAATRRVENVLWTLTIVFANERATAGVDTIDSGLAKLREPQMLLLQASGPCHNPSQVTQAHFLPSFGLHCHGQGT